MFSQELKDYEYEMLIRQGKITNIGEAVRKLNQKYFKIWMKMYYRVLITQTKAKQNNK